MSNWSVRLVVTGAVTKLLSKVGDTALGAGLTLSTFWPIGSIKFAGRLQQCPLPSLQSAVAGMRKFWPVSFRLYGFQIGLANIPRSQIGCGTELVRTTPAASRKPS